jgi:hypothetical protein
MASRLKRRIPVIVSTRGAAAGSGSTAGVGAEVPVGPEWLIPVATYNLGTFAPGATIPLTGLYDANDGTPYFSYVSGQTITGTSVTITVDPVDGDITAPTTETTYTAVIDLDDDPAEADWVARSQADGVVWAHDFRNAAEVTNFLPLLGPDPSEPDQLRADQCYRQVVDPTAPTGYALEAFIPGGGEYKQLVSISRESQALVTTSVPHGLSNGDVVSFVDLPNAWRVHGDGAGPDWSMLSTFGFLVTVVNTTQFRLSHAHPSFRGQSVNTTGYPVFAGDPDPGRVAKFKFNVGSWQRPFAPLSSGNGTASADVNRPGLPTLAWAPPVADAGARSSYFESVKAGWYGHADYHVARTYGSSAVGSMPASAWHGDEYYLQMTVKIPSSRGGTRQGTPAKLAVLTNSYAVGGANELVPMIDSKYVFEGETWDGTTYQPAYTFHSSAPAAPVTHNWYQGKPSKPLHQWSYFNGAGGTLDHKGGDAPYATSCLTNQVSYDTARVGGSCVWMPLDEYFTLLIRVKHGHENVGSTVVHSDTILEVWVHLAGVPGYIKVYGFSALPFFYNDSVSMNFPPGHNCLNLLAYMNKYVLEEDSYQRYAQIIFSKQFIAAPND